MTVSFEGCKKIVLSSDEDTAIIDPKSEHEIELEEHISEDDFEDYFKEASNCINIHSTSFIRADILLKLKAKSFCVKKESQKTVEIPTKEIQKIKDLFSENENDIRYRKVSVEN